MWFLWLCLIILIYIYCLQWWLNLSVIGRPCWRDQRTSGILLQVGEVLRCPVDCVCVCVCVCVWAHARVRACMQHACVCVGMHTCIWLWVFKEVVLTVFWFFVLYWAMWVLQARGKIVHKRAHYYYSQHWIKEEKRKKEKKRNSVILMVTGQWHRARALVLKSQINTTWCCLLLPLVLDFSPAPRFFFEESNSVQTLK